MLRKAGPLAVLVLVALLAAGGRAQQAPKTLEDSGTIKQVGDGGIQIETTKNSEIWLITLEGDTKLRVEGTAEPSYLRGGLTVKFTGEFDKKGALSEDIKELEIFTPQGKNDLGLFADSNSEKPIRNASPGSYEIRGKVTSFKDNEIVVAAGTKKISGKVAEDVAIKVNVGDTKEVRAGDTAKVKATYYNDSQKPYGMKPGNAAGNEVEVTLSKPLTGVKKKTPPKPAKPPKEKKEKKPADETADGGSLDLFGVDNKGKDDAKEEMADDEKPKSKKPTKKPAKDPDDE